MMVDNNKKKVIIGVLVFLFFVVLLIFVIALSKRQGGFISLPGHKVTKPSPIPPNPQAHGKAGINLNLKGNIRTESTTTGRKTIPQNKNAKKQIIQSIDVFVENQVSNIKTNQQRKKDNLPSVSINCDDTKCTSTGTDKQLIPVTIYGLYNYYLYSKDKSVLPDIDKLLAEADNIVKNGYNGWPFQPVYLHCSVLYDIHKQLAQTFPNKKMSQRKFAKTVLAITMEMEQ